MAVGDLADFSLESECCTWVLCLTIVSVCVYGSVLSAFVACLCVQTLHYGSHALVSRVFTSRPLSSHQRLHATHVSTHHRSQLMTPYYHLATYSNHSDCVCVCRGSNASVPTLRPDWVVILWHQLFQVVKYLLSCSVLLSKLDDHSVHTLIS